MTSHYTILSASRGKEKNYLLLLPVLQSMCEPSDAQRHSQPSAIPAGGAGAD